MKAIFFTIVIVLTPPTAVAQELEQHHLRLHASKQWAVLTAVSVAAAFTDAGTTIQMRHLVGGNPETDPLARPFSGLPGPAYIAVTAVFAGGVAYLGHRMENSRHPVIRHLWWIPQVSQTALNASFAAHNELNYEKEKYEIGLTIQAGTYRPPSGNSAAVQYVP